MTTRSFEEYVTRDYAHRTRYDPSEPENVSEAVVETAAAVADTRATELDPLYDAINPDALELFVDSADQALIEFDYLGYEVVVCSEGDVVVLDR